MPTPTPRATTSTPQDLAPVISHGRGAHVWDVDGNEYIEYGSGLRSVSLGHAHPAVIEAVRAASSTAGSNFVRPTVIEVEAAERFLDTVPTAEMVKFAKNGSDVTTAAVRLARAATGRTAGRDLPRPAVLLHRRLVHRHHADVGRAFPARSPTSRWRSPTATWPRPTSCCPAYARTRSPA